MSINVKGLLGGAARVAAGAALLVAAGSAMAPAHAAKLKAQISSNTGGTGPGPLLSTYFDIGYYGDYTDGIIHLTNVSGQAACAYIFVFDQNEELQESCAVPLSANKDSSFYISGLVSNPAYSGGFDYGLSGVVEIISGTPNGGTSVFATDGCDPAASITPLTAVNAWITQVSIAAIYGYLLPSTTVTPFTDDGQPDAANLATLQTDLGVLGSDSGSSGDGVCYVNPWVAPTAASDITLPQ